MNIIKIFLLIILAVFLYGCQSNVAKMDQRYRFKPSSQINHEIDVSDDNIEILAVSGGGHRAAHYTIGMLIALDNITPNSTRSESFLENVDVVSSVSGGSYGVAAYLSSYIEYKCRHPDVEIPSALELLKLNRNRLNQMASAWFGKLLIPVISPQYWTKDLRNIDRLEREYHAKVSKISGCDGHPILVTGDVSGDGELQIPFVHIVNATNSSSGKVFSFHEIDSDKSYQKISCIFWRGKLKILNSYRDIPYSQALASSAAFPPLVTDGIFSIKTNSQKEKCKTGQYLRLTDGGQADDNGIDTALDYASEWLKNTKSDNQNSRAFILSIDALVERDSSYANDIDNEDVFTIAVSRNADLPRYSKKRRQKEELKTFDQKVPVSWEAYTNSKSIFGVSVGFSVAASDEDQLLKFNKYASNKSSDISTFDNVEGLSLEQQINGVAEGYFQTMRKLLSRDEELIKNEAQTVAFYLYCSGDKRTGVSTGCVDFMRNNSDVKKCFYINGDSIATIEKCSVKPEGELEYARTIIRFNHLQEKNQLEKAKRMLTKKITKKAETLDGELMLHLRDKGKILKASISDYHKSKSNMLNKIRKVHSDLTEDLIALVEPNSNAYTKIVEFNERQFAQIKSDHEFILNIRDSNDHLVFLNKLKIEFVNKEIKEVSFDNATAEVKNKENIKSLLECKYSTTKAEVSIYIEAVSKCQKASDISIDEIVDVYFKDHNDINFYSKSINPNDLIDNINSAYEEFNPILLDEAESLGFDEFLYKIREISKVVDETCRKANALKKSFSSFITVAGGKKIVRIEMQKPSTKEKTYIRDIFKNNAYGNNLNPSECNNGEIATTMIDVYARLDRQLIVRTITGISDLNTQMEDAFINSSTDSGINFKNIKDSVIFSDELQLVADMIGSPVSHADQISQHLFKIINIDGKNKSVDSAKRSFDIEILSKPSFPMVFTYKVDEEILNGELCQVATKNMDCDIQIGLGLGTNSEGNKTDTKSYAVNKNELKDAIKEYISSVNGLHQMVHELKKQPFDWKIKNPLIVVNDEKVYWKYDASSLFECRDYLNEAENKLQERSFYLLKDYFSFPLDQPVMSRCHF